MRNLPVHWYEGLFLRPHHLQAAERHWSEQSQTALEWYGPYHYGLQTLEYSEEALANHHFQVHKLQARMRDGTLVNFEMGQEPDRVDLREALADASSVSLAEAFESESVVRVYLAVPKLQLGRVNIGGSELRARYVESNLQVPDESTGGNEQEVEFRQLNARLLLSTQDLSGYEVLPIAQICRASDREAAPKLDSEYFPPAMSIWSWPPLGRGMVRAIYDIIGRKIEVLSQQLVNRGIGLDSSEPGDLERILMLTMLNAAHATLSVIAFGRGIHPLVAYTELCRLLGQLAVFSKQRKASDIPAYDHEDLHRIFDLIRIRVEEHIHAVRDFEYQQRFFLGVGMGLQATLEPQWFNANWQWYIGVNKGELTTGECRELLSPGQLDWKFGSSRQVDVLFQRRAQGLELSPVDRPVRALPVRPDWLYYEVSRQDTPAWRDVQETQTLAVRLKDALIVNLDRLQGERDLVVNHQGRNVTLQLALFAVPMST